MKYNELTQCGAKGGLSPSPHFSFFARLSFRRYCPIELIQRTRATARKQRRTYPSPMSTPILSPDLAVALLSVVAHRAVKYNELTQCGEKGGISPSPHFSFFARLSFSATLQIHHEPSMGRSRQKGKTGPLKIHHDPSMGRSRQKERLGPSPPKYATNHRWGSLAKKESLGTHSHKLSKRKDFALIIHREPSTGQSRQKGKTGPLKGKTSPS